MLSELRQILRRLTSAPGFTAIVVLTLALGIGVNTSVFSLFDQVILRLLPVSNPQELVIIERPTGELEGSSFSDNDSSVYSYPAFRELRNGNQVFKDIVARAGAPASLSYRGSSERVDGEIVSANFFDLLGVPAWRGAMFHDTGEQTDASQPLAVLSHGFWTTRFGTSDEIVGEKVALNGHPFTVVGVAPPSFTGIMTGRTPDLYVPLSMRHQVRPTPIAIPADKERLARYLNLIARLKPGITLEQAEAGIQPVHKAVLEAHLTQLPTLPEPSRQRFQSSRLALVEATQGIHELRKRLETPLFSVVVLVALVLLIACVNVANLMMARATTRAREIGIRLALGATRGAIVRELLLESLILSLLGAGVGLVVARWTTDLFLSFGSTGLAGLSSTLDSRVLAFNFAMASLTGLVFGLIPALQASSTKVAPALKDLSPGGGEAGRFGRFRKAAVVAQVAMSLLLLVAAGLFTRSLYNLRTFDPGFRVDRLLSFSIDPELSGYRQPAASVLYQDLQRRLEALPGVEGVAAATIPVLENHTRSGSVSIEGYQPAEDERATSSLNFVSRDYFHTLGIPLVRGREFERRDESSSIKVAVVNERFVQEYLPDRDPIGRRLALSRGNPKLDIEIVGVVKDQQSASLREERNKFVYLPYYQTNEFPALTFYLRMNGDSAALSTQVRNLVRGIDADLPVYNIRTVSVALNESITLDRTVAALSTAFASLATVLACIGLYGLMAFTVARRTRELGTRIVLGATSSHVFHIITRQALTYLAGGLAIGLPAAIASGRLLESQLFDLSATDPLILFGAAGVLAAAAFGATLYPAWRASRIQPARALRSD